MKFLRSLLAVLLLFVFILPLASEVTYTITQTQLTQLETNLTTLQEQLEMSQTDLKKSREDLKTVQEQLQKVSNLYSKSEKNRKIQIVKYSLFSFCAGCTIVYFVKK